MEGKRNHLINPTQLMDLTRVSVYKINCKNSSIPYSYIQLFIIDLKFFSKEISCIIPILQTEMLKHRAVK